jgi:predicted DNA-binding transcriptional regulator YafY
MQISRLFEIVYLLLEKGTVSARELAERFEVSTRTVYRDVENLSAAGIPVYMSKGRNGGISLMPDFVLDKAVLTQREREDILSALQGLSAAGPVESGEALDKLGALFGEAGQHWIEVDFSSWSWGQKVKDCFNLIKKSILSRHVLTFQYSGSTGEETERSTEPLKLVFRGQAWYLYAYCRERQDMRFFKLSRMEDISMTAETFSRTAPPRVLPETIGSDKGTIPIKFRAAREIAFRIYDEYAHGHIQRQEDGSLIVTAQVPYSGWFTDYLLSYGDTIEVLEPDMQRNDIRRKLNAILGKYQS